MRIILAVVSLMFLFNSGGAQDDDVLQITGLTGKSVRLPCNLPHGGGAHVRWVDWIYNEGRDPRDIYDSERGTIEEGHPNVANFQVDETDYSLTISNLKFENDDSSVLGDAGEYICVVGEEEFHLQLDVGGPPMCTGEVMLVEGDATRLSCKVKVAGSTMPDLTWWLDGTAMTVEDKTGINAAQQDGVIEHALWSYDGKKAECRMKLGEFEEDCDVTLHVRYLVRDVEITPANPMVRVGDEVTCRAQGNPEPRIEFEAEGLPQVTEGSMLRSFNVPLSWQGKQVDVSCKASNTLDGQVENLMQTVTFEVLDERTTTTTTTPAPSTAATTTEAPPPEPKPTRAKNPKPTEAKNIEADKTTVAPTAPKTSTGSTNIAGIVAAVVIVALVVCVIVIAVICIKRKSSSKPPKGSKPVPTKEEEVKAMEGGRGGSPSRNNGSLVHTPHTEIEMQPRPTSNHEAPMGVSLSPLLNDSQLNGNFGRMENDGQEEKQLNYADLQFDTDDQGLDNTDQSPWVPRHSNDVEYSSIRYDQPT